MKLNNAERIMLMKQAERQRKLTEYLDNKPEYRDLTAAYYEDMRYLYNEAGDLYPKSCYNASTEKVQQWWDAHDEENTKS